MSDTNKPATPNTFFMDDKEIDIREGETIFRAGRRHDIRLPHLCYSPKPGYRPDGNCRVCMVEIEGERVLAASCLRTPTPGMKVKTQTERATTARRLPPNLSCSMLAGRNYNCRLRIHQKDFYLLLNNAVCLLPTRQRQAGRLWILVPPVDPMQPRLRKS